MTFSAFEALLKDLRQMEDTHGLSHKDYDTNDVQHYIALHYRDRYMMQRARRLINQTRCTTTAPGVAKYGIQCLLDCLYHPKQFSDYALTFRRRMINHVTLGLSLTDKE